MPDLPDPTSTDLPRSGMPRWVKVSLLVVGALIVLFVVLKLTGAGGEHGPGRHMRPGGMGNTPSSSITDHTATVGFQRGG